MLKMLWTRMKATVWKRGRYLRWALQPNQTQRLSLMEGGVNWCRGNRWVRRIRCARTISDRSVSAY